MKDDLSSITGSYYPRFEEGEKELTAIPLHGRSRETSELLDIYARVISDQRAVAVAVHGESGTGKTSLVNVLRKPVCDSSGYFISGKFFQNSKTQEPYSAIMAAFSDLCDLILQSGDFEERRQEIQNALGPDGRFLERSISSLSAFLSQDPAEKRNAQDPRNDGALQRFKLSCKTFLHAMSSPTHPIVLFIDDIQWADEGSRQLISTLLEDSELKNILLILAYRDEEADKVVKMIFTTDDSRSTVVDLQVQNLDSEGVFQLVSVALGSSSNDTRELSELIAKKTKGNPFHVIQFIETIESEGLIQFDAESNRWRFNVDHIQKEVMVSQSLADLLERKIKTLHPDIQHTLKIASLLGFRFTEDTLLAVACTVVSKKEGSQQRIIVIGNAGNEDLAEEYESNNTVSLSKAIDKGFLEKTTDGYQFSHDKLQAAFRSMLAKDEEERLHKIIGETFLLSQQDGESIYHAAVHLNSATGLCREKHELVELAHINLRASKISRQKCAFDNASSLLITGLTLLEDDEKWTTHFDLAFELTETLAKMELVNGNFDKCKRLTKEALLRGTSLEMKVESLMVGVEVCMASNEVDEMVATAARSLVELGVAMPRKISIRHILGKLMSVRKMVRRLSNENITGLPSMEDKAMSHAVMMLANVSNYCLLKDEKSMAVFSGLMAGELSLKHGVSAYSANAFVVHGLTELSLGNHDRAHRLGTVAMTLLDRFECKDAVSAASSIKYAALTHWKEPLYGNGNPFLDAFTSGFEVGDMVYAIYSVAQCFGYRLHSGEHLQSLETFMRGIYSRLCDLSKDGMIRWIRPSLQFVLKMQSQPTSWRELIPLTGEIMDEGEHMSYAIAANHRVLMMIAWVYKAMLAFHFGFYSVAEGIYKDMGGIASVFRLNFSAMPMYLYAGMTQFGRYRETGKRAYLKKARKYKKALQKMKSIGSPNVDSYLALLDAEEMSVQRRPASSNALSTAYKTAIEAAAAEGFVHIEGLANERAGFALATLKQFEEAAPYFNRALDLYRYEWGGTAKYEWLEEKSSKCLNDLSDLSGPTSAEFRRIVIDAA